GCPGCLCFLLYFCVPGRPCVCRVNTCFDVAFPVCTARGGRAMKPVSRLWMWVVPALVALVLGPMILPPSALTPATYIGLHALICLGLVLLVGMAGLTSFGQAAFVGLGAYTSAVLVSTFGWAPWASLPAALLVSGISAWLL